MNRHAGCRTERDIPAFRYPVLRHADAPDQSFTGSMRMTMECTTRLNRVVRNHLASVSPERKHHGRVSALSGTEREELCVSATPVSTIRSAALLRTPSVWLLILKSG